MSPERSYEIIGLGEVAVYWKPPSAALAPDDPRQAAVDELWRSALDEPEGVLFNDSMLNFDEVRTAPGRVDIWGRFTEYKYYMAQHRQPSLDLGIQPLAVSGLVTVREGEGETSPCVTLSSIFL